MKRTIPRLDGQARQVAKGELIGLPCRVAAAPDGGIVGLEGHVVDETLRTLTLRIGGPGGRRVQLAKPGTTFSFQAANGQWVDVDGRAIEFRSADRTKKVK